MEPKACFLSTATSLSTIIACARRKQQGQRLFAASLQPPAKCWVSALQNHLVNSRQLHSKFQLQWIPPKKSGLQVNALLTTHWHCDSSLNASSQMSVSLEVFYLHPNLRHGLEGLGKVGAWSWNQGPSTSDTDRWSEWDHHQGLNIYSLTSKVWNSTRVFTSFPDLTSLAASWCWGLTTTAEPTSGNVNFSK